MTALVLLLSTLIGAKFIVSSNPSSFDLTLNLDGADTYFRFVETPKSSKEHFLPSIIILDDDQYPKMINSSDLTSVQTYRIDSDENLYGFATVVNCELTDTNLLFAMVQVFNGSFYDISSSLSRTRSKTKRSLNDAYIVRSKYSIVPHAYATITWNSERKRRELDETKTDSNNSVLKEAQFAASAQTDSSTLSSFSSPDTIYSSNENTIDLMMTDTTKATTSRPIPDKSRHLYLEIVAVVGSLITNDLRALLNKTELEAIEILKLYYIHVFMGVEQLYQQSLINETLNVHIRLTKIIFATNEHRLPWELFKNILSISNNYRKSPNNVHLRPNISLNFLDSLHRAYKSEKFDKRYFTNNADHIVTFTRLNLLGGGGSAFVLGTCLPLYKYSIIQEDLNSFSVTLTVAHELGHNLGLDHDETENKCNNPRFRYIMSPINMNTADRRQLPYFSPCSINQLNSFVDNTTTTCWRNKIISTRNDTKLEEIRDLISMKLGQIINIHQQCQLQYGSKAIPYISVSYNTKNHTLYEEHICEQLQCFKTLEDYFIYWQYGAFDGLTILFFI